MKPVLPRPRYMLLHEYWLHWAQVTNAGMPQVVRVHAAMNSLGDQMQADFERRFPPTPRRQRTAAAPKQ